MNWYKLVSLPDLNIYLKLSSEFMIIFLFPLSSSMQLIYTYICTQMYKCFQLFINS